MWKILKKKNPRDSFEETESFSQFADRKVGSPFRGRQFYLSELILNILKPYIGYYCCI